MPDIYRDPILRIHGDVSDLELSRVERTLCDAHGICRCTDPQCNTSVKPTRDFSMNFETIKLLLNRIFEALSTRLITSVQIPDHVRDMDALLAWMQTIAAIVTAPETEESQPGNRPTDAIEDLLINPSGHLNDFANHPRPESNAAGILAEFKIDEIGLTSIARRMPGPANKTIDKARMFAVDSLRKLKSLLSATPGSIVVLTDIGDPPRVPDRHKVVLEIGESGKHSWWAVSVSQNGWKTKKPASDYNEPRFMVFLEPLDDVKQSEFARLVGIDESTLVLDEPKPSAEPPMQQLSHRHRVRPRSRRRQTDDEVRASLKARGINPDLMPTTGR